MATIVLSCSEQNKFFEHVKCHMTIEMEALQNIVYIWLLAEHQQFTKLFKNEP